MELLNVIAAAAGSWIFGAVWYMALSKPWLAASGIECDATGKPVNSGSPLPFVLSAVAMLIVAGFMRHIFATSGITTIGAGVIAGFGIGAFFITPWTMINNAYAMRPAMLTVIDGGYAIIGSMIIGAILTAF